MIQIRELIAAYQEIKENVFELEMFLLLVSMTNLYMKRFRSWDREKDFF